MPLRLIKCSQPPKNKTDASSGCVKLEVNQLMNRKWFYKRLFVTKHAIDTVEAALSKAQSGRLEAREGIQPASR